MNNSYMDIRSRIPAEPIWFDENAVPRYCEFSPEKVSDIYSDRVALVLISCQGCNHQFMVAFSSSLGTRIEFLMRAGYVGKEIENLDNDILWKDIQNRRLHYGDPPNINCCAAGPTMNCIDHRVLEAWQKENFKWVRKPEFEVPIEDLA